MKFLSLKKWFTAKVGSQSPTVKRISLIFLCGTEKAIEVRLTVVDLDPMSATNQSFGDRKFTSRGKCIELIGRTTAKRKGRGVIFFKPRFI